VSDMDLEAPDADAAEQHLDAVPDAEDNDEGGELGQLAESAHGPLEADQADASEQARVVGPDDDDYR
jgi:hypothetical protein